ncbi:hypothetical protein, partial [Novosphingobium sp. B-7]|uniref:hypothetical protein n=1 Tax=Novosphingobium sp. B-7 TaxID=1298855 RepID=UPI00192C8777
MRRAILPSFLHRHARAGLPRGALITPALALALVLAGCGDNPAAHAAKARSAFAAQDFVTARMEALSALDSGKLPAADTQALLRLLA